MTDADETRNPESPEDPTLTPEQAEAFETARGFADLQMMAAQEEKAAGRDRDEGSRGLPLPAGCSRSTVAALIALVLIVVAFAFYAARLGSDPSKSLRNSDGSPASTGAAQPQQGPGEQDAPTQVGGTTTGAHDDSVPHEGQQWMPTYVQAGTWSVALAREDLLAEGWSSAADKEAKRGANMLLVDVYVTNNGSADSKIDASFFSLRDEGGNVYRVLGVKPQDASPGSAVYLEPTFEVPIDTQGLVLQFTPPTSSGGEAVDVTLPEIAYSKAQ